MLGSVIYLIINFLQWIDLIVSYRQLDFWKLGHWLLQLLSTNYKVLSRLQRTSTPILHLKIDKDYIYDDIKTFTVSSKDFHLNRLNFYSFRNSLSNTYPFNKLHVIPFHYAFNYHAARHLHVFRALMRVAGNWVPYSSWNFTVWLASGHSLLLCPPLQARLQYCTYSTYENVGYHFATFYKPLTTHCAT